MWLIAIIGEHRDVDDYVSAYSDSVDESCHSKELLVLFGSFLVSLIEMAKCWNGKEKKEVGLLEDLPP